MSLTPTKKVCVESNERENNEKPVELADSLTHSNTEEIARIVEDDVNNTCKRVLFLVLDEEDDDQQKPKKQNSLTLQLSPIRAHDEIKDLRRQVSILTESCNTREAEMKILRIKMKGYAQRSKFDCPNTLELLPYLEQCNAFQYGCGSETPIVLLLNTATVRIAYGDDTQENFCLSITLKAVEYVDEEEEEEEESEDFFTTTRSRKRNRQPETRIHYLRVRYECGNGIMLSERGDQNMRYIRMNQSCTDFVHTKNSTMKFNSIVGKFAGYAGIPQKALLLILAMGVNLLPEKCKDFYIRQCSNPETMLSFTRSIANNEPHYLLEKPYNKN